MIVMKAIQLKVLQLKKRKYFAINLELTEFSWKGQVISTLGLTNKKISYKTVQVYHHSTKAAIGKTYMSQGSILNKSL